MAFIQCECGEQIELNKQVGQAVCPGCGKRFTMPIVEEPHGESADSSPTPVAPRAAPMSPTMVQDLPAVTQFEQGFGESLVAMASYVAPAAAAGIVGAAGRDRGSQAEQARRQLFSSRPYNPTPDQLNHSDTAPNGSRSMEFGAGLRLLDRYEVQRKIGQGGMSTVFEAYDEVRGENVALKILLPNLAAQPTLQERFLQEGRLASNFSHSNIARVYDLHQTDTSVFISMELLQGATLRHDMNRRHDQRQSYQPTEVLAMLGQICDALEVVHGEDVIHRDLKPENLWLGLDGTLKVMDFGIARDATGTAYTTGGRGSGTPYYIAPEQLAASPLIDGRADQYSVAIIMYELLTGSLPQGAIVPPHEKNSSVPRIMSEAIYRALDSDPTKRFDSMGEFQEASQFNVEKTLRQKLTVPMAAMLLIVIAGFGFSRWVAPLLESEEIAVWGTVAPQTVSENNELRFSVRSAQRGPVDGTLTFRLLSDAPVGATLESETGEFAWTPTEAQGPREYSFTVMAVVQQDGKPPVITEESFNISVTEHFDLPVVTTPAVTEGKEHELGVVELVASDPNIPSVGLRFELKSPPVGMSMDPDSGVVQWTPNEQQGGKSYQVPVRVFLAGDGHRQLYTERMLSFRIDESIDPPIITSPERISGVVNQPSSFRVTVRDPNVPEIDDYFRIEGGDQIGMTLDPKTGEIFWTPTAQQIQEEIEVRVQVAYDIADRTEVLAEQMITVVVDEFRDSEPGSPEGSTSSSLPPVAGGIGIGGAPGGGFGGVTGPRPVTSSHGTGHNSAPVHGSPFPSNVKPTRPSGGNNGRPTGGNQGRPNHGNHGNGNHGRPGHGNGGGNHQVDKIRQVIDIVQKIKNKKKQNQQPNIRNGTSHHRDRPVGTLQTQSRPSSWPIQGINRGNLQSGNQNNNRENSQQQVHQLNSHAKMHNGGLPQTNRRWTTTHNKSRGDNRTYHGSNGVGSHNAASSSQQNQRNNNSRNHRDKKSDSKYSKWKELKKLSSSAEGR